MGGFGKKPRCMRSISVGSMSLLQAIAWVKSGEDMDFIANLFSNINFETIFQLIFVSLIMLAGPAVIFVLAFRSGDL